MFFLLRCTIQSKSKNSRWLDLEQNRSSNLLPQLTPQFGQAQILTLYIRKSSWRKCFQYAKFTFHGAARPIGVSAWVHSQWPVEHTQKATHDLWRCFNKKGWWKNCFVSLRLVWQRLLLAIKLPKLTPGTVPVRFEADKNAQLKGQLAALLAS